MKTNNADRPAAELTKRELFAAMAMQGLLANHFMTQVGDPKLHETAKDAIRLADALLEKLESKDGA